jgi:outer membrane protein
MQRFFLAVCLLFALPSGATADALGWRIGANAWLQGYDTNADINVPGIPPAVDFDSDDEVGANLYISFEHPVPLFPNVLVQYSEIESSDEFGGVELTHTDLTLYYELLDNWVNLDLGLTGRVFNGGLKVDLEEIGLSGRDDIDYVMPALYGQLRFDLPFSGLSIGAEGNWGAWDDDEAMDIKINLAYEFAFGLGLEGGYRNFEFDYDGGATKTNITVDGLYGGVFWDF